MRVLGVDPGLALTGYGVIEAGTDDEVKTLAYAAIRTAAKTPLPQRLARLYDAFARVVTTYRPDVVAVERLYFGRNVTTAMNVGQARGVVLLCAAQHHVPVVEYTPAEVKQALVGYGNAAKHQVQAMVAAILGLPDLPRPDDVADALAVAVCHVYTARSLARWQGASSGAEP